MWKVWIAIAVILGTGAVMAWGLVPTPPLPSPGPTVAEFKALQVRVSTLESQVDELRGICGLKQPKFFLVPDVDVQPPKRRKQND